VSCLNMLRKRSLAICWLLILAILAHTQANAAQFTLSWTDNSIDEDGFKIERGAVSAGPFTQIGTTGSDTNSYTNSGLADATNYCYRVRAYNSGGDSTYTNVACGTTPATLTVSKNGTGTVTSSPAGINCGSTCSSSYVSGTSVTLTATAGTNYSFTGWSGACTGTGSCVVTMNAAESVMATFTVDSFALTMTNAGTGNGTVTSSPSGINCGSTCSANYNNGTSVTLTATASSGSTFTGWSDACTGAGSCNVTMNAAKSVTAAFTAQSFALTLVKAGTGSGTVASSPSGINCGSTCSANYNNGTSVTLTATASSGSTFTGWSGACTGTGACTVTMDAAKSVSAAFGVLPPAPPSALSIL